VIRARALAPGLAALVVTAAGATAQPLATAAVPATAEILLPPITGAGLQNLVFGSLAPGATADVPPGPAAGPTTSAGWRFSGVRKGRIILWSLTLPASLAKGAFAIPIQWNNPGYGTYCVSRPGGPCLIQSAFNPASAAGMNWLFIPNSTPSNDFDLTVYAGARLTVPPVPPGVYTAQVTMTMAYLF
jgi:hypothetical protein